ncbi:MAG: DUF3530 family protein [Oceanospirillaceae bacterium]
MKKIALVTYIFALLINTTFAADDKEAATQDNTTEPNSEGSALETQEEVRVMPNPLKEQQQDLAAALTNSLTEVIKLSALEEDFDIYYLSADEKEPIGSILFFPDERTHSDWPINLNPLRIGLTRHKWQTAVITLPSTKLIPIPDRAEYSAKTEGTEDATAEASSAEQAASTKEDKTEETTIDSISDTAEDINNMADLSLARAKVTAQMLKEKSEILVIAGIGQGATWATAFALSLSEADLENSRLLLINPQQSADISAGKLREMISQLKVNTFDIYSAQKKFNKHINAALARKRAANQSEVEEYLQVKAPHRAWSSQGNEWLFRKVLGLLKVNIEQKIEADKEQQKKPKTKEKMNQKPGSTT